MPLHYQSPEAKMFVESREKEAQKLLSYVKNENEKITSPAVNTIWWEVRFVKGDFYFLDFLSLAFGYSNPTAFETVPQGSAIQYVPSPTLPTRGTIYLLYLQNITFFR